MKITVYSNLKDAKPTVIQNATVVLADILRASSAIATFLYHGAAGVHLCPDPGTAKKLFAKMKRGEGLLAGERNGDKIPGFQLGGSPLDSNRDKVRDRIICFATDSPLKPLKKAKYIILGSFLNLGEVYDSCLRAKRDVVIACAGGQEDVIFAGMLVDFLQSTLGTVPVVLAESAKEAMSQYKPWQGRLVDLLRQCEEGKELIKEGFSKDLDFCSKVNKTSVVPYLKEGQLFVKENTPKPRKPLIVDGKSKGGGVVQKGKSIKITAPLFPKNPEHPVPGMEKGSSKKHATPPTPVDKKAALKKGEAKETHGKKMDHPKEASPAKSKRAPAKPTAMFSKKTVATAVVSLKKETAKTKK